MTKLFFLASALVVLASCGNNDNLPAPVAEPEPVSIDLRSMNYEGVMTLLSQQTSLKGVTLTDGEITRNISELVASSNVDAEVAGQLVFDAANPTDSVDLTVTPEYVAVRMNVDGQRFAYMTFADQNQQNEIVGLYEETVPATRSGAPAVTRGESNASFKLNLTAVAGVMNARAQSEGSFALSEKELKYQASVVTRGFFSNLFKKIAAAFSPALAPVVKTPTIDIYLMREKGSNPLTHEMNWQANDAMSALKDVQGNVKFNVYIKDCDYKGNKNAETTVNGFSNWMRNSSYRATNGIFILCRWGGWDGYLGMVEKVGDYNVNNDLKAYGVSATNAWNKYVMAHEIGHVFGAVHVAVKWWQLYGTDLMASESYDWMGSGKHKNDANRNEIKRRMTLN